MKFFTFVLLLSMVMLCSCSTTSKQVSESARATQAIYDQARFAFPLSFSEHIPMNGKDFADTIGSYTTALRRINIVGGPFEFQVAFHNYVRAWDDARTLAALRPNDVFTRSRNGQTLIVSNLPPNTQPNDAPKALYETFDAYSADFNRADREIEKTSKLVQALARKQGVKLK